MVLVTVDFEARNLELYESASEREETGKHLDLEHSLLNYLTSLSTSRV